MFKELCQHSEQREQPDASGKKNKKTKKNYIILPFGGLGAISGLFQAQPSA